MCCTLRSTIALANVYYDFPLSGMRLGRRRLGRLCRRRPRRRRSCRPTLTAPAYPPDGANFAPVAAAMAGVTYDMGNWVADLGYRGLYIPQLTNGDAGPTPYYVNHNTRERDPRHAALPPAIGGACRTPVAICWNGAPVAPFGVSVAELEFRKAVEFLFDEPLVLLRIARPHPVPRLDQQGFRRRGRP